MKKVSVEMNLGKNTKARFPLRIDRKVSLKMSVPSDADEIIAPFSQAFTMAGVNSEDYCYDVTTSTEDYHPDFPVNTFVHTFKLQDYILELRNPRFFDTITYLFEFDCGEHLPGWIPIIKLFSYNFFLLNLEYDDDQEIFPFQIFSAIKEIYGNARSFNAKFRSRYRRQRNFFRGFRKRRDTLQAPFIPKPPFRKIKYYKKYRSLYPLEDRRKI